MIKMVVAVTSVFVLMALQAQIVQMVCILYWCTCILSFIIELVICLVSFLKTYNAVCMSACKFFGKGTTQASTKIHMNY